MHRSALIALSLLAAGCSGHDDTPHAHAPSAREIASIEEIDLAVPGAESFDRVKAFHRPPTDGVGNRRIVIIPGTPSDVDYWGGAMALIDPEADVYAIERPGYNGSGPKHAVADLVEQAKAIDPLIASYARPIVLIGHSYGASVALTALKRHPGKIEGVILVSPYVIPVEGRQRLWFDLLRRSPLRYIGGADTDHFFIEVAAQRREAAGLIEFAARSCAPMLIVHGDADDIIPFADSERLKAMTPPCADAELVRVPEGDHFLSVHSADALARAVNSFIARRLSDLFRC